MLTRRHLTPLALALASTALVGCSSSDDPEDGGTDSGAQTYETVDDLVDAVADAGWECSVPLETPRAGDTENTRFCNPVDDPDALGFAIFPTPDDVTAEVAEREEFAEQDVDAGREPASLLVGPNWVVNGPYAVLEDIEPELHGDLQDLRDQ